MGNKKDYLDELGITNLISVLITKLSTLFCTITNFNILNKECNGIKNWQPVNYNVQVSFSNGIGYFNTGFTNINNVACTVNVINVSESSSAYIKSYNKTTLTIEGFKGSHKLIGTYHCNICGLVRVI